MGKVRVNGAHGPATPLGAGEGVAEPEVVRDELRRALAHHLLSGRLPADVAQVLLAAVTVLVFWEEVSPVVGLGWFAGVIVAAILRALHRARALTGVEAAPELLRLVRRDVVVSAALWGLWVVLVTGVPVMELAFLLIIFAGLVAAATSTLVADYPSFYGFTGTLTGPFLVVVVLSGHTRDHMALLLLLGLFVPFMVLVHRRAHQVLVGQLVGAARLRVSEEEAARRGDFLNAVLDSAPSPIVVLDQDLRVVQTNPAFEQVLGYEDEAVHGRRLPDVLEDPEEGEAIRGFLDSIRIGSQSSVEAHLRRRDGRRVWLRISGTRFTRNSAEVVILVGEDVTKQVDAHHAQEVARVAAEEAARAKSAFLASMSHEIRTPMNGVLGMIELLLDTDLTPEQRELATVIRSSGQGLLGILNDILDVSKIEAGQLDLEEIDFDLTRLVNETARSFSAQATARGNELAVDLGDRLPRFVHGDPVRLRQVLSNLLSNAVKFTETGDVVVSARSLDADDGRHRVRFSVRDTGIGIPAEKHEQVFHEFEQADKSTTRTHGGTGLGLTICRRLVELLGGHLSLDSEEGEGSEFFFTLLLREVSGHEPRRSTGENLEGKRFLVVDDNDTARRIARGMLLSLGAARVDEVSRVDDGIDAVRRATEEAEPYAAIVLDHLMPGKDGFEFAGTMHASMGDDCIPMLMLTSSGQPGATDQARRVGIGGYLSKPVARDDLARALGTLLVQSAYKGEERRVVTRETLARASAGRTVRLLLAEDNVVNQQVALALLKKRGHEVDLVENGAEAVDAVRSGQYDVVLMDVQMPVMDGLEATRAIRADPDVGSIPILAVTAHAFAEERERCRDAGMNDFLTKPFKPADLYAMVDRWAGAPGERRSDTLRGARDMQGQEGGVPPVDLEGFRAVMRQAGVEEIVDSTVEVYVRETPPTFSRLASAIEAGDAESIRSASHSMKSSSGNIRAKRLSGLMQKLEDRGARGEVEAARNLFEEVRREFDLVMEYLRAQST